MVMAVTISLFYPGKISNAHDLVVLDDLIGQVSPKR